MPITSRSLTALASLSPELQDLLALAILTWPQVQALAGSGAFQILDRHVGGRGMVYQLEPVDHALDEPIWRQSYPDCWKR